MASLPSVTGWRPSLIHFQDDHERHLLELRGFLDARDAEFSPTFGVRRTLKQGRVVLASVLGDRSLLRVLRSQEQNLSEDYGLAVSQPSLPPELAAILNAGFADEQQHLDWLDRRSAKLGQPGD